MQPLANSYVLPERAALPDKTYPLHARVCDACLLVQVERVVPREEIFAEDYAYFSSYSESWLAHCRAYVEMAIHRFGLNADSKVVEIASNDGYMLQYMVAAGIPSLGIEPAVGVANAARAKGVSTEIAFFGEETARRLVEAGHAADIIAAKNVLAHVPDINDFVAGVGLMLKPEGVYTVEFPHLLNLIQKVQFDTIYHEHFTYLTVLAIERIFVKQGLRIFDIEEVSTHGGSLRVFACRADANYAVTLNVARVRDIEIATGLSGPKAYSDFTPRVKKVRAELLAFLDAAKAEGKRVVGYGAAAKGNTLFNYCGIASDRVAFVCDRSPAKQGKLLPGSRIPVKPPEAIAESRPDYVLIVPWNLRDEIMDQLSFVRSWGGKFVTAIPEMSLL
jgi:2-polyprenyl-3-methyl-5-hydroxy-6-metoxy-1,4-benzoquinol methylase